MNTKPRVHAMIVAAGRGSRFGAPIAKQYLPLQGKTILQHSVARLALSTDITKCLLVISEEDSTAQTLDFVIPVHYATGGTERWQSVVAGLEAIIKSGAAVDDLVLIHDAARPAVPLEDIEQVISVAMLEPYGAILATPVADTLKKSQPFVSTLPKPTASSKVDAPLCFYAQHTIERDGIWQAQTPQVFRVGALHDALSHIATNNLNITDEASAFETLNLPIRLVSGSRQNIKLTYPDDTVLLAAILTAQK